MIFDIPPALYVAQWYIKKIFQNDRIFEFRHFDSFAEISEELKTCRFAFFTPNQIEFMPNDCFDLFYNMNSLMEMRFEQIDNFLCHIGRTTRSAFFSRQYKEWHNADDNITVNERHFRLDQPGMLRFPRQTLFTPASSIISGARQTQARRPMWHWRNVTRRLSSTMLYSDQMYGGSQHCCGRWVRSFESTDGKTMRGKDIAASRSSAACIASLASP